MTDDRIISRLPVAMEHNQPRPGQQEDSDGGLTHNFLARFLHLSFHETVTEIVHLL